MARRNGAEEDAATRLYASNQYDLLVDWLNKVSRTGHKDIDPSDGVVEGSLAFPWSAVSKDKKVTDFWVVLTAGSNLSSGGRHKATDGLGQVTLDGKSFPALLISALGKPGSLKSVSLYKDDRQRRKTFIHEFIHLLDMRRFKGDLANFGAAQRHGKDQRYYYGSPSEFNAYFQEGAHVLELMIKDNPEEIWQLSDTEEEFEAGLDMEDPGEDLEGYDSGTIWSSNFLWSIYDNQGGQRWWKKFVKRAKKLRIYLINKYQ